MKDIITIVENSTTMIKQGNYEQVVIIIGIIVIFSVRKIYEFYWIVTMNKVKKNIEYLTNDNISKAMRKFVEDHLNNEIFRLLTGINAEIFLREKLMLIHEESKGFISYRMIKHALPYLKLKRGELSVEGNLYLIISGCFNLFIAFFCIYIGSLIVKVPFLLQTISVYNIIAALIVSLMLYFIASIFMMKVYAILDAKNIAAFLNNPIRVKKVE